MKYMSVFGLCVMFLLSWPQVGSAQLPAYYEPYRLYEDGVELFEKGHYGAAVAKFDDFLAAEGYERLNTANEINANARFYQAVAAYYLLREDAEPKLQSFVAGFPENTKWSEAQFYLGRLYFDQKAYDKAMKPLRIANERGLTSTEDYYYSNFMLGYAAFMQNDLATANTYFNSTTYATKPYPFVEDAQYYKAIITYQNGDYGQAYESLKALSTSKKYGEETKLYLATSLLKLNRTDELFELAEDLDGGRRGKEDAKVYFIVANAAYEKGDFAKSADYFKRYLDNRGELSRSGYFRFAQSFYKLGQYDAAIPVYQQAIARERDTLTQIASYYLGFCFLEKNEKDNARAAFEIAAKTPEPSNPQVKQDALWQYAKVCFDTKYYEESLNALRFLDAKYPNSPYRSDVKGLIGELLVISKNYPDAIAYYEKEGVTTPRMKKAYQQANYYYGVRLVGQKKYDDADKFLTNALRESYDPELTASAQYWLAESQFRQEKYPTAVQGYQQYMQKTGANMHPDKDMATYGLGWAYFQQKQYANAYKQFDTFVKTADRSTEPRYVIDAHLRAGDSKFLQRDYTGADSYYQKVLSFNYGGRDYASYQLAESQYRQGNYPAAVNQFSAMVPKYPRSELQDNALDRASEISLTWLKDYDKTQRYAKALVSQHSRSPLAAAGYNRLALATYFKGDEKGAVNYFKKVLEDYPSEQSQCQIALENLSQLLSASDYDKVFKAYKSRNPQVNENLAGLVFNTGVDRFYGGEYEAARDQFSTYINDYPGGANYYEALLMRARTYRELGQMEEALTDYNTVFKAIPKNSFTQVALLEAADIKFTQQKFNPALELFRLLEQTAEKLENKTEARFGMAKCYRALGSFGDAVTTLQPVVDDVAQPLETRLRAALEVGTAQYEQKRFVEAKQTLESVVQQSDTEYGARAQYTLSKVFFDQGKYAETKEAVLVVANKYPTYNYWKAKAFLVAAQADIRLNNQFQARATLESLVNNPEFPDIAAEAEAILKTLN